MSRLGVFVLLAGAVLTLGCSQVRVPTPAQILPPEIPPDGRFHMVLKPFVRAGPTDGYLQTPRGGAFGTTSSRRPLLGEIGVSSTWEVGAQLDARWKRHGATLEWSRYFMNGDGVLATDLVTQGSSFPAGTMVSSDSFLTYLGIHYSYLHEIRLAEKDKLELRPGFGARWIDVAYKLTGSNGAVADRTYTSWAPNILLDWSWWPRQEGPWRFAGRLSSTFDPVLSAKRRAYIFELVGRVHYQFSAQTSAFVESGYRHTLLDDTQPNQSNRIHTDFGPWIGIGFETGF